MEKCDSADTRDCSSYECFILKEARLSNKFLGHRYAKERLKSSLTMCYDRSGDLFKQYGVLYRIFQDILEDDDIQWHPPLIRHYTNF